MAGCRRQRILSGTLGPPYETRCHLGSRPLVLFDLHRRCAFSVLPGLEAQSLGYSIALGAFLGLVTYATFDLTCLAMLKDFPVVVVYVDLAWGIALTAGVSASGYGFGKWLGL